MIGEKERRKHPKPGCKALNGNLPERPGREPVLCNMVPGTPPCGMGSHGFICTFADGTCLRHPKTTMEETHHDEDIQSPAAE